MSGLAGFWEKPVSPNSLELKVLLARIAEGASERERDRIPPHEQIQWIRDAGLGRLRIPAKEGGAGASMRELFKVVIDLAAADSNVAHILRAHFWFVEEQLQSSQAHSRKRWLALINEGKIFGNATSEQSGLQVGLFFETTLTPNANGVGYRLNGQKFYSTGSLYSDWVQIFASTPQGTIAGATIPVEREGLTIKDDWDGFGQRLTGTGTTILDNVYAEPAEVTDYGSPFALPPSYQFAFLQLYLQALTAGILRSVQEDAVALVRRRRRSFSHATVERPTDDHQLLQVVGEIAADAFAAEAIVLAAADRIQAAANSVADGLPDTDLARDAQIAAAEAKVAIDRFSYQTASRLFDAGGASATQAIYNLDRHWRNARTTSTHNPTFLKASAVGNFLVNGSPPPLNGYF
ncbi:MAG TPA: acyl-CoA dehydrogenase family protein [Candidatus Binataceae bacterium]|nr:acyl-CoA dehydrogenase family protein [Candidatus Binataceae bacterium]